MTKTDIIERDRTPDDHSSIVGGSSAARILGCPGSVDLLAKLPAAVLNESSSYADEGTALHEVLAYLVDNDVHPNEMINDKHVDELFEKYGLKEALYFEAVVPAYRAFTEFCDEVYAADPNAEIKLRVECRVEMPGIEGAFGTTDILMQIVSKVPGVARTVIWDWKFGKGVPVAASYFQTFVHTHTKWGNDNTDVTVEAEEETLETGNDQLMFYARASMHTHPDYFSGLGYMSEIPLVGDAYYPVELVICQPRIGDGEPARFTTNVGDLENFRLDLVDAVEEALSGHGHLAMDNHYCRFAKCKSICPLWKNAPVLAAELGEKLGKLQLNASLAGPGAEPVAMEVAPGKALTYAQALAAMLDIAEIVEPYINEAQAQAHAFMEAGGEVPGYKLVPKRAGHDGWVDDKKTDDFLARQGVPLDERRKPWVPVTPAVARTILKSKGQDMKEGSKDRKLLEKYVAKGVSSGSTVARNDDPREAIERTADVVKKLADKIGTL